MLSLVWHSLCARPRYYWHLTETTALIYALERQQGCYTTRLLAGCSFPSLPLLNEGGLLAPQRLKALALPISATPFDTIVYCQQQGPTAIAQLCAFMKSMGTSPYAITAIPLKEPLTHQAVERCSNVLSPEVPPRSWIVKGILAATGIMLALAIFFCSGTMLWHWYENDALKTTLAAQQQVLAQLPHIPLPILTPRSRLLQQVKSLMAAWPPEVTLHWLTGTPACFGCLLSSTNETAGKKTIAIVQGQKKITMRGPIPGNHPPHWGWYIQGSAN